MNDLKSRINKEIENLKKRNLESDEFKIRAKLIIYKETNKELEIHKNNILKIRADFEQKIRAVSFYSVKKIENKAINKLREKIKKL